MGKIRKIEKTARPQIEKKRVAAYCRVSLATEKLDHSFSAQTSYYNQLINSNPEWEFAGIYTDHGITGTLISKRKGFQQMVQDALGGKIDIILAKSVTRFARNTVDLLDTVRLLKRHDVEVRFEKENISSMTGDGELMLTILASFAQEESRSISENIKWAHRKRMKNGIPHAHFRIYGYVWEGENLIPVPDEAIVVREIYEQYNTGKPRHQIAESLNEKGFRTRAGRKWNTSSLDYIIHNITYIGDLLLQKEFRSDPLTKRNLKNNGELPQYFVEGHHEAIISKEVFEQAQSRPTQQPLITAKTREDYIPYKEIMICGHCGSHLRVNKSYGNNHIAHYTLMCPNGYRRKDSECYKSKMNIKIVNAVASVATQTSEINDSNIADYFSEITLYPDHRLELIFTDGSSSVVDASKITCRNLSKYLEENQNAS